MILPSLLALFFTLASSGEVPAKIDNYFEGSVVYRVDIQTNDASLDTGLLREMMGYSSVFYFKEGNFKQVYDRGLVDEETYIGAENRTYYKRSNNDTLFWRTMATPEPQIMNTQLNYNSGSVLNIPCNELVLIYPTMTKRLWYNPDTLPIDPAWFGKYLASDKHLTSQKMKSLFLRCDIESHGVILSIVAIHIRPHKVDGSLFAIPPDAILKEEPGPIR